MTKHLRYIALGVVPACLAFIGGFGLVYLALYVMIEYPIIGSVVAGLIFLTIVVCILGGLSIVGDYCKEHLL